MTRLLAILALAIALPLSAQEALTGEPDVTIRQEGDRTVEEYRVNGFLYAIDLRQPDNSPATSAGGPSAWIGGISTVGNP